MHITVNQLRGNRGYFLSYFVYNGWFFGFREKFLAYKSQYNFEIQFCTRKPAFNELYRLSTSVSICVIWNSALEICSRSADTHAAASRSVPVSLVGHTSDKRSVLFTRYFAVASENFETRAIPGQLALRVAFHFPCSPYYSYYYDWSMTLMHWHFSIWSRLDLLVRCMLLSAIPWGLSFE